MALTDHVAILLHHALDRAVPNPKNKQKIEYYAVVALPPEAAPAVGELLAKIYPGINIGQIEFNCRENRAQAKPYPGVPDNWYILRLSSRFAPELYDASAQMIAPELARSKFYAGMSVRVSGGAWARTGDNGPAASFNLFGIMDAGKGGTRLSLGSGATGAAFAAHSNPGATAQNGTGGQGSAFAATHQNVTAFAQPAATTAQSGSDNPFQQSNAGAAAQSANPFA